MEKGLFKIFCALNLFAIIYGVSEEIDGERIYDLNGLLTRSANRYENSLRAKQNGIFHQFKFGGINEDSKFEPSGSLLQNSSKCLADIIYMLENIRSPWAMELFDSFGKPESGILQGNLKWLGDYNECLNVSSTNPNSSTFGNFRGKYCSVSLSLETEQTPLPITFSTAVCLPDSCSHEELQEDALQLLHITGTVPDLSNFTNVALQCISTERHLNGAAISVIVLLSLFSSLVLIGSSITAFKYFKNIVHEYQNAPFIKNIVDSSHLIGDQKDTTVKNDDDNTPLQDDLLYSRTKGTVLKLEAFLNCFCIFKNGSKILNTNTSEGELLCIHGIRFLSMCWVILGHTYLFGIQQMTVLRNEICDK